MLYCFTSGKLNLGVDYSTTSRDVQREPYALLEGLELGALNSITTRNENQLVENTLTYNYDQGSHALTFLAGHSYQKTFVEQQSFNLTGFADNDVEPVFQDQTSTITQSSFTESKSNNDTYPLDPNANTLDDYPFGTIFTRFWY